MKERQKTKRLYTSSFYTGLMIAQQYNFELTPEFMYLIEALKVEGYWSLKSYTLTIQNKNLPFLRYIESIVKKLSMKIYKRTLVKIKPNFDDFKKEDISLKHDDKLLCFHLETSPFDGSRKIVTSLPYQKEYSILLKIKDKKYDVYVKFSDEEIETKSELKCWAYFDIRFPDTNLIKFLSSFVGDKKKFRIEKFLFQAKKEYVASAFSALIDAEGSVDYYKLTRKIRIRMRNKNYLQDWKKLLDKFDITSRFSCYDGIESQIVIEGWEDINKLKELGVKFHHSKKERKFEEILKSYKRNQISRNTSLQFYTNKLKEINKSVTASEFAKKLGKGKRVVNHYLKILMEKKMIRVDKSKVAYLYSYKK